MISRRLSLTLSLGIVFALNLCRATRADEITIPVNRDPVPVKQAAQAPVPAGAAETEPVPQRTLGNLRIEKFRHMSGNLNSSAVHFDGPVTVIYKDPVTAVETILTATDLDYNPETDRARAPGISTVTRPDGRFQGYNIDFDLGTNSGSVENAVVASDFFRMSGSRIERLPDGSYHLTNGDFTTCIHGRPDYKFQVKDLTFQPDKIVKAHNVRLFLGGFALPAIPFLKRSLSGSSTFPLPIPGYDRVNGLSLHFLNSPVERHNETLDLDFLVNFRRIPTGYGLYQHDLGSNPFKLAPPRVLQPTVGDPLSGVLELTTPPTYREYSDNRYNPVQDRRNTFYAIVDNLTGVYNRRVNRVVVSRFPEVGVQFLNLLGHGTSADSSGRARDTAAPDPTTIGVGAAARYRAPNAPAQLNVTAGVGEFIEDTSHVSAARFSIRTTLATQPILLGRRLSARFGVTDFVNIYTKNTIYQMVSPEAELNITPTRDSLFNIGYRYAADAGQTPFIFDRRDIRHELRLQYQVSGPWAFGIATKIDLERSRAYDGEIAIVRNFDCMRVGLVYQLRTQSFNILFNLLPARRDKSRPLIPLRAKQ